MSQEKQYSSAVDELDELLAEIEEEKRSAALSKAKELQAEAERMWSKANRLAGWPDRMHAISLKDLRSRIPKKGEVVLRRDADRLFKEADRLEAEAMGYLSEEEASRRELKEAQHLATDRTAALKFVRMRISRSLPANLRRFVPFFDSHAEPIAREAEELWANAEDLYEMALFMSRSVLTWASATKFALEAFLPTASPTEKNEIGQILLRALYLELPLLWVKHELRLVGWKVPDAEPVERARRELAPDIKTVYKRYGLSGLCAWRNLLLRQETPEERDLLQRLFTPEETASGPHPKVLKRTLAEIEPSRIAWLLPGRLARGEITMVNGWPGAGKTSAIVDMVARLSRGVGLEADHLAVTPQRVLYLATEDRPETLRLRFEAASANLRMIDIPAEREIDHLRLPSGEAEWKRYLHEHDIGVVVLDPLMGLVDDQLNAIREQDMRRYMRSLRNAIEETGTAVFGIRHPNKASASGHALAIAAASNSLALSASARLELLIASVPDSADGLRAMAGVKNNLSALAPTLGFHVVERFVPVRDGGPPESVAAVNWVGALDIHAEDLMRRGSARTAESSQRAKAFLREYLANGPRPKREVMAAAAKQDIAERTLQRAFREVGDSDGNRRGATWRLRK